jgi:hypothetical protein
MQGVIDGLSIGQKGAAAPSLSLHPAFVHILKLVRHFHAALTASDRADSTGRRNTLHRGGVYGTTSGVDV